MNRKIRNNNLLPFHVIVSASVGEADAIDVVLSHYKGYITELSTKHLLDTDGNFYIVIDEWLKHRLESKLIAAMLSFNVA